MSHNEETTTTAPASSSPAPSSPAHGHSVGASIAERIKGVGHVIHGIGESLRGNALDLADGLGGHKDRKAHDTDIAEEGRAEREAGISEVEGHSSASSSTDDSHPHPDSHVPAEAGVHHAGAGPAAEVRTGTDLGRVQEYGTKDPVAQEGYGQVGGPNTAFGGTRVTNF